MHLNKGLKTGTASDPDESPLVFNVSRLLRPRMLGFILKGLELSDGIETKSDY